MAQLLDIENVSQRVAMGRSTVYALVRVDKFPRPLQILRGPKLRGRPMNRWVEAEIEAWIADQASARDSGEAA